MKQPMLHLKKKRDPYQTEPPNTTAGGLLCLQVVSVLTQADDTMQIRMLLGMSCAPITECFCLIFQTKIDVKNPWARKEHGKNQSPPPCTHLQCHLPQASSPTLPNLTPTSLDFLLAI